MKEALISVIIPVYKVENYIEECLDSVLSQSYTNLQVILIDDGSPDRSGEICEEYAKKDSRIEVYHQKNAGVSAARNKGLDVAKGKYISFVDSDDVLLQDAYIKLLKHIEKNDLVIGRLQLMDINGILGSVSKYFGKESAPQSEIIIDLYEEKIYEYLGYLCDKIFKREIIESNKIRFNSLIKINEDRLFILEYMLHCKNIGLCDEIIYLYRQREQGILNDVSIGGAVTDSIMTVIPAFENMKMLALKHFDSKELYYLISRKSFESALDLMQRVDKKDIDKYKKIKKFFKINTMICLKNPEEKLIKKLKIILHYLLRK